MKQDNSAIAFTRNPICFADSLEGESARRSFIVQIGGTPVYTGHYTAGSSIDISEIAESYVDPLPSPEGSAVDADGILMLLEDSVQFEKRFVSIVDEAGNQLRERFFAIPGGVSPQNFRRLRQLDTDIFRVRLLDKRRNFFLTSRTHGWRIVMDELEVYPLAFISIHDEDAKIWLRASGTDFKTPEIDIIRGVFAIDINAARLWIAKEHGYLASAFDVFYDGFMACQIVMRHTLPEKNSTVVKFRNSLGAFELLHLSGVRESGATPREEEDWKRFDSVSGRFTMDSVRKALTFGLEIETGPKTEEEIRFIMDMVASEEVYLKDRTGWVRAIPGMEQTMTRDPHPEPTSIKVSFTIADEYDNLTPDIADLKDFETPRIFSRQHSSPFN